MGKAFQRERWEEGGGKGRKGSKKRGEGGREENITKVTKFDNIQMLNTVHQKSSQAKVKGKQQNKLVKKHTAKGN